MKDPLFSHLAASVIKLLDLTSEHVDGELATQGCRAREGRPTKDDVIPILITKTIQGRPITIIITQGQDNWLNMTDHESVIGYVNPKIDKDMTVQQLLDITANSDSHLLQLTINNQNDDTTDAAVIGIHGRHTERILKTIVAEFEAIQTEETNQ